MQAEKNGVKGIEDGVDDGGWSLLAKTGGLYGY